MKKFLVGLVSLVLCASMLFSVTTTFAEASVAGEKKVVAYSIPSMLSLIHI